MEIDALFLMHRIARRSALRFALGATGFEPATSCSQMSLPQGRLGAHRAQARSVQITRSRPVGVTRTVF